VGISCVKLEGSMSLEQRTKVSQRRAASAGAWGKGENNNFKL
jgi:hypothetical protein